MVEVHRDERKETEHASKHCTVKEMYSFEAFKELSSHLFRFYVDSNLR
jgi:hypothetical protein